MYPDDYYLNNKDSLIKVALDAGYKFVDNVVDPEEYPEALREYQPIKFFIERQKRFAPHINEVRNFARIGSVSEKYALGEINSKAEDEILLPAYVAQKGGAKEPIDTKHHGINMYSLFKL